MRGCGAHRGGLCFSGACCVFSVLCLCDDVFCVNSGKTPFMILFQAHGLSAIAFHTDCASPANVCFVGYQPRPYSVIGVWSTAFIFIFSSSSIFPTAVPGMHGPTNIAQSGDLLFDFFVIQTSAFPLSVS